MSATPTSESAEVEARLRMPLIDAMSTQRSIRRLTGDPVDDSVVLRLLELALKAPSGANLQPVRFLVVRDPEVKERLARLNRFSWGLMRRMYGRHATTDTQRRTIQATDWQARHFAEVPVLVVVCSRRIRGWPPLLATAGYGSIYPGVQNLLLAARAVGLGAGLVTLPLWSLVAARRALGLPRRVQPVAIVPLGWPHGRYGPTTRRPVGEVTHVNRWGHRPYARR